MPNPRVANPRVAERAPWRSTKRGVAGVRSLLEMPTDSCHFPCTSDIPVRAQNSLARKALSATRGLAKIFQDLPMFQGFSRVVLCLFVGFFRGPTRNIPARVRHIIGTVP